MSTAAFLSVIGVPESVFSIEDAFEAKQPSFFSAT
jgi:hypothetical protein